MGTSGDRAARADAVITVHMYEPAAYEEPAEGPGLSRIHVEEAFSGDIEGDGVAEFLQVALRDGSASFVGIERVRGKVADREGTFVLQDAGTVEGNVVSGEWFVVPGTPAPDSWPGCGAPAGSVPTSARARMFTWTTGSSDPPRPPIERACASVKPRSVGPAGAAA